MLRVWAPQTIYDSKAGKQTRDAGTKINAIAKITSQKLKLLAAMGKTNDSIQ